MTNTQGPEARVWRSIAKLRLSRRRAVTGLGGVGVGLAFGLAGCGGGSKGKESAPASGLISVPVDTTQKAKPGGVLKSYTTQDVVTFDVHATNTQTVLGPIGGSTYPRLLKFRAAKFPDFATGETEGDLAESSELSGDKLQLTLRLRSGLKWEQKAPTNGREIDAQDVAFSFNRFAKISPVRADLVYSSDNPGGPVESISTVDSRTVTVKMKQPHSSLYELLAAVRFFVLPREADGGFDPKGEVRGYGPWLLDEYRASSFFTWRKNPDYYMKGRPFPDKIEAPIISEYATRMAQFRTGSIWTADVRQEDILQTKKDVPALVLRRGDQYGTWPHWTGFGYEGDSPWRDERVRQALALLFDREAITDAFANRQKFQAEGLDIPVRYYTVVGPGFEGYWLDPQDEKAFGSTAKYYKFDPAEAKKLMSAAGYANGFETTLNFNNGPQYGADYSKMVEVVGDILAQAGIKAKLAGWDFGTTWLPNFYYAYTKSQGGKGFNGLLHSATASFATVTLGLEAIMHSQGSRFHGASPDGKDFFRGDPTLDSLIDKMKLEFDRKKLQELTHEFLRYVTGKVYRIPSPVPVASLGFNLTWPVVGNYALYRTWPANANPRTESDIHQWVDDTQPPLRQG